MGQKAIGGRTYTVSFSVTRPDSSALEWARSVPARDLALLAGALVLFLLEPAALYWIFERADWRPPRAEKVVLRSEPEPASGSTGLISNEDIITPLNVRDPSALIIPPPGRPTDY